MEPLLSTLRLALSHLLACLWLAFSSLNQLLSATTQRVTTPVQLAAAIEAWEFACASGWSEPAPEPVSQQLPLPAPLEPEPTLVGSGWDSWSGNHWLEDQQIDELEPYGWAE